MPTVTQPNKSVKFEGRDFPTGQVIAEVGYLLAYHLQSGELSRTLKQLEQDLEKEHE